MDLGQLKQLFAELGKQFESTPDLRERIERAVVQVNSVGFDEWGLDPRTLENAVRSIEWIYRKYFRVRSVGIERLPEGRVLLVGNHGGQLPLDGMMIALSVLLDAESPRIARGMIERWFPSLPFISTLFVRCGGMVGDHRNCRLLLEREECVLVFPEGVKGSGKSIFERYQLQNFGTGFVRLALETKAPIVPVAVVGCEETYPGIYNFKKLAKLVGAPYLPVTPFFPFLGPLGMLPLPTQVTLRYGEPIHLDADPDASDQEIALLVDQVKAALQKEMDIGLQERGEKIFG
jgi:1-acyl-sn-glycerol-3-phosphate acyltransferase